MVNPKVFDDIAKRLCEAMPESVRNFEADLQRKFRDILQNAFAKLDLVTRDELDAQCKVLAKTRAKMDNLEQEISRFEKIVLQQTQQEADDKSPQE